MLKKIFSGTLLVHLVFVWQTGDAQQIRPEKYSGQPQSVTRVRIASASVPPEKWNKEANWERIEEMVSTAALEGEADVVVTPEGCLEGYVINEVNGEKDESQKRALMQRFLELGEPMDGPYIRKASVLSDRLDIYLVLGFLERCGDALFNSVILIDPDGDIIGKYSKTHFAQGYRINPDFYQAGDDFPVFSTPFGKVGILICYDRQLPEPARILAVKGAQVLFVPSYGSYTDRDGWNTVLLRTRAYENRLPVVFSHPKQSLLITRKGEIEAIGDTGQIVYYEIDTSPERYEGRFRNRRPALYSPLSEGGDPAKLE